METIAVAAAAVTMAFSSESLWFQEEQGIVGDAVQSEETDFLLQVVSLPDREEVEVLDGHPEDTEELLLREVSLPGRETCRQREREREEVSAVETAVSSDSERRRRFYLQPGSVHTGGQFAPPSVGHHQRLIGVNLMTSINQSINAWSYL